MGDRARRISSIRAHLVTAVVTVLAMVTTASQAAAPEQAAARSQRASKVQAPAEIFGFQPGADYKLADYDQILRYFRALDAASDRVVLEEIGTSTLGRPIVVAVISSEANLRNLDRYREINRRLALARGLTEDEAVRLAKEGKATVWIDGGLHASEVAPSQHTPELAYWLATDESEETRHIRDNVIALVCANINPDGLDIVSRWYQKVLGTPFETAEVPELYHHYVGHDNNRDWYMFTQKETQQVAQVFYHRWFPQIIYNHHQTGPFPGRIWLPPAIDPLNPYLDPLVVSSYSHLGQYMLQRFMKEGKPGVTSGINYRVAWAAGFMHAAQQFHNMVGLFTETALYSLATPHCYTKAELGTTFSRGVPLPTDLPSMNYIVPWEGGCWRLRDAMDYVVTGSRGALSAAAKLREDYLYNIFHMGRRQIAKGEHAQGGPFAYVVVPDGQHDPGAAVELLRIFRTAGVEIRRADKPFRAGGRDYPAGAYVIPPQAFWPFVLDMMEPKKHADRFDYPGGPAEQPYDLTGYSLPLQMGVKVDRVPEPFEVPGPAVETIPPASGAVRAGGAGTSGASFGHVLSHAPNASALAANRLLKAGAKLFWTSGGFEAGGRSWPAGTLVVRDAKGELLEQLAKELGLEFVGIEAAPVGGMREVRAPRIGIYQSYVANMAEGWTRWVLDQYEFQVERLHDPDLRTGDLSRFDVIVLPDQASGEILRGHAPRTMPSEYVGGVGAEGAAALKRFVEAGGWLVAAHESVGFASALLGLPIRNVVEGVGSRQFHAPGSLLRLEPDPTNPLAYGMAAEAVALTWHHAWVMEVIEAAKEESSQAGKQTLEQEAVVYARFPKEGVTADGWVIGADRYLAGRPAAVRVPLGKGQVVLLGFRPDTRGQSRNVFKLLFNPLFASTMQE